MGLTQSLKVPKLRQYNMRFRVLEFSDAKGPEEIGKTTKRKLFLYFVRQKSKELIKLNTLYKKFSMCNIPIRPYFTLVENLANLIKKF